MMSYLDLWPSSRDHLEQSSPESWVELSGLAKEHWVATEIVESSLPRDVGTVVRRSRP